MVHGQRAGAVSDHRTRRRRLRPTGIIPDSRAGAPRFDSIDAVRSGLAGVDYLADEGIAGVVFLADRLAKPVLVEGPAGTGKTELAKSVARLTGSRLIRLQCYEGLDESKALYEWNYKKQLLRIQADSGQSWQQLEEDIFSEEFLLTRPLLEAIRSTEPVVLLVDEVDRVELETEALLLEILSEYQVSIPELGTVRATQIPLVFLTSNNTRELSEALKRRCLYLHIDYPELDRERAIIETRVPGHQARARRPGGPHRAVDPHPRPEEGPLGVRDPRLGPDPGGARGRVDRRRAGPGHPAHPAQVPVRHRPGRQGAGRGRRRRTEAGPAAMLDLLSGFVAELRAAGIPVSLTEHLDAAEALRHVPLEDREALKYALGASLVKSSSHWQAFETAFEVYFSLRGPEYTIDEDERPGRADEDRAPVVRRRRAPGERPGRRRRPGGDDPRGAGRPAVQGPARRQRRHDRRRGPPGGGPLRRHGGGPAGGGHLLPLPDAAEPRPRRGAANA